MTRTDYDADGDLINAMEVPPPPVDLASFLPLALKESLIGQVQIIDSQGATFVDRAYQMRGFNLRPDFKDEWPVLAPQLVEAVNGYGSTKRAAGDALEALREISGAKLPVAEKRALARAVEALVMAVTNR